MANPSLQIGDSNWAIKEDNLLGYSKAGTRFVPQPITMTRASAGTRVNSAGLVETVELLGSELVTNGDFATDSDWSVGSGGVITNGELVFASQNTSGTFQTISHQVGKTYKVSVEIKSVSNGSVRLDLAGGGATTQDFDTVGVHTGYVTPIQGGSFFIKTTAFQGSIDNISVKESTKNNLARVDYTDGTSSLLAEPQRTNLIPYSEDFSNGIWQKQTGVTPTYNTTETLSPDGTYNATKFIGNGSSGVLRAGISITGVVARSVYLKSVTGTVNVVLKDPNQTVTSKSLTITTEWQRFDLTEDNTIALQGIWIDDIPVSGIYMWGAQLEEGSYATSYIPTDGSTVTRIQDQYEKTGISDLINSEEGVLYAEIAALDADSTYRYISFSDGTADNSVRIYLNSNGTQLSAQLRLGGVVQCVFNYTVSNVLEFNKIAFKYKENDFALWIGGVERDTDTSGSTFSADTLNELSFDRGDGTQLFFGKVKQLQIFKTALSDSELATLTT